MNKLYYFASLLTISIMLSGCRSEELGKPSALKKLKSITSGCSDPSGNVIYSTTSLEYNSQGKCSREIFNSFNPNYTDTTSYTYSHDTVFAVFKYSNKPYFPYEMYPDKQFIVLNESGFISKSVSNTSPGSPDWIETYLNDSNGNCIKLTQGPNCDETNFIYSGGNMVSKRGQNNCEYTYYPDKINTISPSNGSLSLFGKGNKNLIKTELVTFFWSGGSYNETNCYTYEFDANNYVTKRLRAAYGQINWDKYTYQ